MFINVSKFSHGYQLCLFVLLVRVFSVVLFRLVPMISFRSSVCSFRLIVTDVPLVLFHLFLQALINLVDNKLSACCLGSISPCLTHHPFEWSNWNYLFSVVLTGNSVKTKIPWRYLRQELKSFLLKKKTSIDADSLISIDTRLSHLKCYRKMRNCKQLHLTS